FEDELVGKLPCAQLSRHDFRKSIRGVLDSVLINELLKLSLFSKQTEHAPSETASAAELRIVTGCPAQRQPAFVLILYRCTALLQRGPKRSKCRRSVAK
ncbi:hypothetical protein ACQUZK_09630, partial [Streptococcus pyogenes]|uniref:hypothetical protein n=1 Tax=Streptococcus pyogenes TaxID=1314 RepID=UPI003DA192CE